MVRISHAVLTGLVAVFFVAIIAFLGGWTVGQAFEETSIEAFFSSPSHSGTSDGSTPPHLSDSFAVFWDVWELVDNEFYHDEPLNQQQMTYGAIHGMLASLGDEYTIFQEPEAAERSRESMQGRFEGIGIYMAMAEGEILVDRPIRGSPAMQAGLQSGDVIVSVDGQAVAELIAGLEEAEAMAAVVERIRGPKGTPVRLEVRRPPQTTTFEVEIVRDEVPLISVNWDMLAGDVAYIQITEFKATTTDELDEALRDLLPQQPRGLVLDLRNNPGGFLTTAQEVLGRFYNGLALREHMSDGTVKELTTISGPREVQTFELPMVVLINGGSASAAEIVAGALRDRRPNTTLLGETTFGKGSVQNIHRLRDGSSTRITIAHWFTPNGDEIHQIGITPEYVVNPSDDPQYALACPAEMRPAEGASACQDAQLVWSMRVLTNSATPPPPAPTPTGRWQRELRSAA